MESVPASLLGAPDRWRNIEGVITFFRDRRLGPSGSWVSYMDAGIVEGIERGIAIALGRSTDTGGNPGLGRVGERPGPSCPPASCPRGRRTTRRGARPSRCPPSMASRWPSRTGSSPRLSSGPLIHPELSRLRVPFYDWFTDVSRSAPSYQGCEMAYGFAQLHPIAGVVGVAGLFLAYVSELFDEYLADTAG